jgi:hypothetical protein
VDALSDKTNCSRIEEKHKVRKAKTIESKKVTRGKQNEDAEDVSTNGISDFPILKKQKG